MKRAWMGLLFALLPGGACIDSGYDPGPSYGQVDCARFTACDTCTPVLGCGWCSMGSKGACVDQPNACAGASNFYWTWESSGCPAAGDAGGGGGPDAGAAD